MNIMKTARKSALHVVDRDTKFSAVIFLQQEPDENVQESFLCCLVEIYGGFPGAVTLD